MSKQANLEKPSPAQREPAVVEGGGSASRQSGSSWNLLAGILILALTATLCVLTWFLYPHNLRILTICGFVWGALMLGLLLIRAGITDDKLDRIHLRLQDFRQEDTNLLQELRREQRETREQLKASEGQLASLQTRLDTTSAWIEQILKAIKQPGEMDDAQLKRIETLLEMLKSQAERNAATLRQLSEAVEKPVEPPKPVGFRPTRSDLSPAARLQEATSYFAAQLVAASQAARVAFEALQKDARCSLDLEADLSQRGDQMLQPTNSLEWERIERDIYRPLSLLVSSQEMQPEESQRLFEYLEEIDAYRRSLHQLLVSRFRVQRIPILPEVTKLDPNLHKPVEDSWLKTTAPEKHLVIYEVVAAGFQREGQLIRKATVKHYRHDKTEASQPEPSAPIPSAPPTQTPPATHAKISAITPQPVAGASSAAPRGNETSAQARPETEPAQGITNPWGSEIAATSRPPVKADTPAYDGSSSDKPLGSHIPAGKNSDDARQETTSQTPNSPMEKRVANTPASDAEAALSAQEEEERLKLDSDDDRVQKF